MTEKLTEYQELILAALLHDIGKFYQRAGFKLNLAGNSGDAFAFDNYTKRFGSEQNPKYYYYHSAMTDKFFREYLPPALDRVGHLAALHHVPENANEPRQRYLAKMIELADWLSAGERTRSDVDETTNPKTEPLISIFSQLSLNEDNNDKDKKPKKDSYLPLGQLDPAMRCLFPVDDKAKAFQTETYQSLWDKFILDLKSLREEEFLTQLYYLLQKDTILIPSAAYKELADISLFHHLKSVAAITACLYQLDQTGTIDEELIDRIKANIVSCHKEKKAPGDELQRADLLLLGGDISGIQDFIYQVTSEKALKGLRARSFYLQLISEVLATRILDEFNLPECNILYCGGGNFYLLLPALNNSTEKIRKIQNDFDSILLRAHRGKLAVAISAAPLTYVDFSENFADRWVILGQELAIKKRRKFSSLLSQSESDEVFKEVFGPYEEGGEKRGCQICGQELEEDDEENCSMCQSFISLADELKTAAAIALKPVQAKNLPSRGLKWYQVINSFGYEARFLDEIDIQASGMQFEKAFLINSTDFAGRFLGYWFVPKKTYGPDDKVLTLEKMAETARGIRKWGVLRADVDRLGKLFKDGLGKNKTISRVDMLSFMISAYFNGRISQLEAIEEDYHNNSSLDEDRTITSHIYTAYSGGDDLFMIGPWSEMLELANMIYKDFRRFTSDRLSLSAGIYLAPTEKFPIYQAAQEAKLAEDRAKEEGRNKLTIFDVALPWESFNRLKDIIQLTEELVAGENGLKAPRSLLTILYSIYEEKELKADKKISLERVWRLYYAIRKITAQFKTNEIAQEKLNKLVKLVVTEYEIYPYLNIATRVADYLTR